MSAEQPRFVLPARRSRAPPRAFPDALDIRRHPVPPIPRAAVGRNFHRVADNRFGAAKLVRGPCQLRKADTERRLQILATDRALGEFGDPQRKSPAVAIVEDVERLEVRDIDGPSVLCGEEKAPQADSSRLRREN